MTLRYTCSDGGSDGRRCPAEQTISGEGITAPVSKPLSIRRATALTASFGPLQLDKTKPTISGSRTPAANSSGWNDSDVTVSFTCADNAKMGLGLPQIRWLAQP
ncbi:MAG: hypothetical protein U0350_18675 [Caldilineaceae bacterium]